MLDFPEEMPTYRELAPKSRRGNDSINSQWTERDDPSSDECRRIELQSIADEGQRRGEVRANVDSAKLATLIASTLEGSIMVSRLQKKEEPRDLAVRHLEEYLETGVGSRKSKAGAAKS